MQKRIKSSLRREGILRDAAPVFAERGFHGTSTRDLAAATGVSEALLYRHFRSKALLFEAVCELALEAYSFTPVLQALSRMPAGTRRLVAAVHHCSIKVLDPDDAILARLTLQSLLADGAFAQRYLQRFDTAWRAELTRSIVAARSEGQLDADSADDDTSAWAVHTLAFGLRWAGRQSDLDPETGRLRDQALRRYVRFVLRGIGVKRPAILRLYENDIQSIEGIL